MSRWGPETHLVPPVNTRKRDRENDSRKMRTVAAALNYLTKIDRDFTVHSSAQLPPTTKMEVHIMVHQI